MNIGVRRWLVLAAFMAVSAASAAAAQSAAVQPSGSPDGPIIAEVLREPGSVVVTVNGFSFPEGAPTASLGMRALAVFSSGPSSVTLDAPGLDDAPAGTYLLALTWPGGGGAVFYHSVPASGPRGPAGPAGPPGAPGAPSFSRPAATVAGAAPGSGPAADHGSRPATNTHYGSGALARLGSGVRNSAFGAYSLGALTSGLNNSAVGTGSLRRLTTGRDNAAVGLDALQQAVSGAFNAAFGSGALKLLRGGQDNVAVGAAALLSGDGSGNVAVGRDALRSNLGSGNVAVGFRAGAGNRSGSFNLYLGAEGREGDTGVVRLGTLGVHTRTYLAGEVHGDFQVAAVYQ